MELNFKQLNLLSIALTVFYDEVCKTGTTQKMKDNIMELSKLVNGEIANSFDIIELSNNFGNTQ